MNVQETKQAIKYLPWTHSIMLTGPHGLGKSEMWRQSAKELSVETGTPHELIDIRLAEREPGDVIGFPRRVTTEEPLVVTRRIWVKGKLTSETKKVINVMTHDLPVWFPTDPDWHGFILFDELDRSTREVQQSVMEMSLDHQLNMVPLPEHCRVGACCNGNPDVYTTLIPCPALISRFVLIPFKPTVPEWQAHFDKELNGHPAISRYILKFAADLDVPEGLLEPYKQYPNRRGWCKLSDTIKGMQTAGIDLLKDLDFLMKISAGYIGDTVAVNFVDFVRKDYKVHDPEDILNKWNKELEREFADSAPTDVSFYSKVLVKFAGKSGLTKKQMGNLTAWFFAIPKESAAGFYNLFINEERKTCTEWYKSDPRIADYVMTELLSAKG